jgi:hypothetical protein
MGRRRASYSIATVTTEIAFALAAFACGLYDAPLWITALAAIGMLSYWSWSRRLLLNRMRGTTWAMASFMGVVTIISIVAGAYWLGLASGGTI